jgi:hypothetical protein
VSGTTTGTTTTTAGGETGTGLLCVPAQTSMNLGLITGLEFDEGQGVVLSNAAGVPLHYHLRGFLVLTSA